jgi:hypothetical protein
MSARIDSCTFAPLAAEFVVLRVELERAAAVRGLIAERVENTLVLQPLPAAGGAVAFLLPRWLLGARLELDLGDEGVPLGTPAAATGADPGASRRAVEALVEHVQGTGDLRESLARQQRRTREAEDELDRTREKFDSSFRGQRARLKAVAAELEDTRAAVAAEQHARERQAAADAARIGELEGTAASLRDLVEDREAALETALVKLGEAEAGRAAALLEAEQREAQRAAALEAEQASAHEQAALLALTRHSGAEVERLQAQVRDLAAAGERLAAEAAAHRAGAAPAAAAAVPQAPRRRARKRRRVRTP